MPAITSTGLGSGLQINDIVTAIIDAEKVPAQGKIDRDAVKATEQISAYGSINNALSTFKDSYSNLSKTSSYSAVDISSSNESVLTATAGLGAQTGVYDIEVIEKAQAQSIASATFDSPNDSIGTGTMKVRFGSYDETTGAFTVNADTTIQRIPISVTGTTLDGKSYPANNTLSTFRDAINEDKDNGISASIINDGSGYRLVMTSDKTGEEFSMEITVEDDDGDNTDNSSGISQLVYSETDKNMTQSVIAKDAEIVMNGLSITRDSNDIESVITGVTIKLLDTKPGENIRLNINKDTSTVESEIRGFVDNYNVLIEQLNEFSKAGSSNGEAGVLVGDATVRSIENQLRGLLNNRLEHLPGSIKSFANLGIFTNRDGTLEINEGEGSAAAFALPKFSEVIKNNVADVADFFTATGTATDSQVNFTSSNSLTKPGTYSVEVSQLATKGSQIGALVNNLDISSANENDTFQIRVDGILSNDIVIANKLYDSVADLATELQSKINSDSTLLDKGVSVIVTEEAGKLKIESSKYGATSTVAFTTIDTNFLTDLGINANDIAQRTTGLDVIGKIDGADAFSDGQFLLSESGDSSGIKVEVTGGALGNRGTVSFSEGTALLMNDLLIGMIDKQISSSSEDVNSSSVENAPPSTLLDSKTDSLYKKLTLLDRQDADLKFKMEKYEARLYKQFNAMDSAVAALNGTMNSLTSMLDQLPGYTKDK